MRASFENTSGEGSSSVEPELLREANADLIARSVRGVFPYSILVLILAATTDYIKDHPVLFWGFVVAIVITTMMRITLAVVRDRVHQLRPAVLEALPRYCGGFIVRTGGCHSCERSLVLRI